MESWDIPHKGIHHCQIWQNAIYRCYTAFIHVSAPLQPARGTGPSLSRLGDNKFCLRIW
jgi:hypothetical protein